MSDPTNQGGELLTASEVAAHMRGVIKPSTLAKWRSAGVGPRYIRLGTKVLYRREAVAEWLAANEQETSCLRSAASVTERLGLDAPTPGGTASPLAPASTPGAPEPPRSVTPSASSSPAAPRLTVIAGPDGEPQVVTR